MGAERDFSFSSFLRLATRQQHTIIAMIKANSATPTPTDTPIIVPVVQKPEQNVRVCNCFTQHVKQTVNHKHHKINLRVRIWNTRFADVHLSRIKNGTRNK